VTGPGIRAREQAWQEPRLLPTLKQIPPDVISLFDYEPLARERLSEQAWVYLSSGAGDGVSLADNRRAFEALHLVPRVLTDIRNVTTAIDLLGLRLPHPVLFAPVGYQKLFHPDGERASAAAAAATETLLTVSTEASVALEEIAAAGEGAPQWFQLYFQADRGFTRALVERAKAAGYRAIVVTVDAPLSGLRNAEQRVRLKLPPGVEAVNLRSAGTRADVASLPPFHAAIATAPTWDDVGRLIRDAGLPVLLQGIL
jgi:4-hydroxymandelate oxidase